MAESAVTFLLDKLVPLLEEEVKLLKGVHGEVQFIKDELESMQAFLRDADARQESDKGVKAWVKQVRDVAYDTEDILDEFMLRLAQQFQQHGFVDFLQKTTRFVKNWKPRHQIATQIQDIKARVHAISERRQRYNFSSVEQGSSSNYMPDTWTDLRGNALLLEEAELVGIDEPREQLIRWLVEGETSLEVLWVVGMGGLGKTTLVKKVYDDQRATSYFQHHAWITVSQTFKTEELLRDLLSQLFEETKTPVPQGVETMKEDRLKQILKDFLQQKRYVIVFDDIWSMNAWEYVKHALPDCECGSKIMITTRSMECVDAHGSVYNLQPLSPEESWTLFCKKTFQSNLCPPQLEKQYSQTILQRCTGLPLAIVALGGLLSTKDETVMEWEKVLHSLGAEFELNENFNGVKRILSLSFIDLPYYLKSCFFYLSFFPEDSIIDRMRLIRLWSAEGFIKEREGWTIEEVADNYLHQLMKRSLIQIADTTSDGRVRRCRVHDLMREIILSQCREENFGIIVNKQNKKLHYEKIRRLSIHQSVANVQQSKNFSHLRSLFMFGVDSKLSNSAARAFFGGFRLLKVLELGGAPMDKFPIEIVNMFHLRYLGMRSTMIKSLPNSIGKLENLETLDLKHAYVSELPIEILKLQKLRHLLVYRYELFAFDDKKGFKAFMGMGGLVSLQKLSFIEANQDSGIIRDLGRLNQLRRLGVIKLRRENGSDLCSSIEKMSNLHSLDVTTIVEEEILDLQSMTSPPPFLERLYMNGRLERLPHWMSKLDNLVKIKLRWSRLGDDPLEALEALPSLLELELLEAYNGEVLCFKPGGFQRLNLLTLDSLDGLRLVKVGEGAMPSVHKLVIEHCGVLEKVPLGIERLTNLKKFYLRDMPDEFTMRLRPNAGGEDHWKVAHISDVRSSYRTEEGLKSYRI